MMTNVDLKVGEFLKTKFGAGVSNPGTVPYFRLRHVYNVKYKPGFVVKVVKDKSTLRAAARQSYRDSYPYVEDDDNVRVNWENYFTQYAGDTVYIALAHHDGDLNVDTYELINSDRRLAGDACSPVGRWTDAMFTTTKAMDAKNAKTLSELKAFHEREVAEANGLKVEADAKEEARRKRVREDDEAWELHLAEEERVRKAKEAEDEAYYAEVRRLDEAWGYW